MYFYIKPQFSLTFLRCTPTFSQLQVPHLLIPTISPMFAKILRNVWPLNRDIVDLSGTILCNWPFFFQRKHFNYILPSTTAPSRFSWLSYPTNFVFFFLKIVKTNNFFKRQKISKQNRKVVYKINMSCIVCWSTILEYGKQQIYTVSQNGRKLILPFSACIGCN